MTAVCGSIRLMLATAGKLWNETECGASIFGIKSIFRKSFVQWGLIWSAVAVAIMCYQFAGWMHWLPPAIYGARWARGATEFSLKSTFWRRHALAATLHRGLLLFLISSCICPSFLAITECSLINVIFSLKNCDFSSRIVTRFILRMITDSFFILKVLSMR